MIALCANNSKRGLVRSTKRGALKNPVTSFNIMGIHLPKLVHQAAHFGTTPPTLVVDVGGAGLDSPGDSLLFFAGESISATVSAPSGTTLYYLCTIHPWMQGSITVR